MHYVKFSIPISIIDAIKENQYDHDHNHNHNTKSKVTKMFQDTEIFVLRVILPLIRHEKVTQLQ